MDSYHLNKLAARFFGFVNRFKCATILPVYKIINRKRGRRRILIYTDSRGFEVTKLRNRKCPFSSYVNYFIRNYETTIYLCPRRHTSLLDFIYETENVWGKFDIVILHCGIVDFAPRPESSYEAMLRSKNHLISQYEIGHIINKQKCVLSETYEEEQTYSFMNREVLTEFVLPKISKIKNLIYVSVNPVLLDWDGIYWRSRPSNINEQMSLDLIMRSNIKYVVDLSNMSAAEIKLYTADNVHYTEAGFKMILHHILNLEVWQY